MQIRRVARGGERKSIIIAISAYILVECVPQLRPGEKYPLPPDILLSAPAPTRSRDLPFGTLGIVIDLVV